MSIPKQLQNLNEKEKQWLVQSAALRPDANVADFIDSFSSYSQNAPVPRTLPKPRYARIDVAVQ